MEKYSRETGRHPKGPEVPALVRPLTSVTAVFLIFALALLVAPIAQLFLPFPIVTVLGNNYYLPFWFLPFLWLGGVFDLLILMHLARAVGRWHAKMAKAMLARPGI